MSSLETRLKAKPGNMSSSANRDRHSSKSNRSEAKSVVSGGRGLLMPPASSNAPGCYSLDLLSIGSSAASLGMLGASSNLDSEESRDSLNGSTKLELTRFLNVIIVHAVVIWFWFWSSIIFLVACYATLHPASSVRRSVGF